MNSRPTKPSPDYVWYTDEDGNDWGDIVPPTDPRKPGLVGSQITPNRPSAMPTPRIPLDEGMPPIARTREVDEVTSIQHTKAVGKRRQLLCRNTQKIGDTLFKCDLSPSDHTVHHREKGRVVKKGKRVQTVGYEVIWWDTESEVIRAT